MHMQIHTHRHSEDRNAIKIIKNEEEKLVTDCHATQKGSSYNLMKIGSFHYMNYIEKLPTTT